MPLLLAENCDVCELAVTEPVVGNVCRADDSPTVQVPVVVIVQVPEVEMPVPAATTTLETVPAFAHDGVEAPCVRT